MDVMFWLAVMGIVVVLVLAVLAGVSLDTHRQQVLARQVAEERRKLAEERRRFTELREGQAPRRSRHRRTVAGAWEPDWDDD